MGYGSDKLVSASIGVVATHDKKSVEQTRHDEAERKQKIEQSQTRLAAHKHRNRRKNEAKKIAHNQPFRVSDKPENPTPDATSK